MMTMTRITQSRGVSVYVTAKGVLLQENNNAEYFTNFTYCIQF